jgi:hypothetical protein
MRFALRLLLAALFLSLSASTAHAARGMEIGVQDDAQFLSSDGATRAAAFAHARALGAKALRANVSWARVAVDPFTYDLTAFDRLIDEAAANGMRVQLTLAGPAPAWATADHRISTDHPDPAQFAQFAGFVAARYAGRVRAISIWNEPNWHNLLAPERICGRVKVKVKVKAKGRHHRKAKVGVKRRKLCVTTSARVYRGLYVAGYAAVKAAAPGTPVWIGETNPYVNRRRQSTAPLAWLRQLACADPVVRTGCTGVLRADGYAHHPYAFDRSPSAKRTGRDNVTIANLGALSKALKKLRKRIRVTNGSIYLTEFAYYSSGPNAKPEKKRAAWTRKAFEIALKAPKVRQLLYYQLVDPPVSETWRTGLIGPSGKQHPAYGALEKFAKKRRKQLAR